MPGENSSPHTLALPYSHTQPLHVSELFDPGGLPLRIFNDAPPVLYEERLALLTAFSRDTGAEHLDERERLSVSIHERECARKWTPSGAKERRRA
ncbi:MAG: hypothetical protein BRD46_05330 [Bacteroidetes bacterium QS_8_68_15]|nr:MAG: hypothetical protein BRD46_05330 [Bacteroidetes bacterium QS_8_68_15]